MRGHYYARKGEERTSSLDTKTFMKMEYGKFVEEAELAGWEILAVEKGLEIDAQKRLTQKQYHLSGRPDLRILAPSEEKRIIEIKATNTRSFMYVKNKPNPTHVKQLQSYMWMDNMDYGELIYFKLDWADMVVWEMERDENVIQEIKHELIILNRCWESGELPPVPDELVFEPTLFFDRFGNAKEKAATWRVNWQAKYCNYHKLCVGENWEEEATKKSRALNKKAEHERLKPNPTGGAGTGEGGHDTVPEETAGAIPDSDGKTAVGTEKK